MTSEHSMSQGIDSQSASERIGRNLKWAFYFLLCVTGSASWMGFYELMQAGSGTLSIGSIIYSGVAVAVLAGVMGIAAEVSVGTWRYQFGRVVRVIAGSCYFVLGILAVSLAFAFWWSHFAAQNATAGEVDAEVARVEADVQQARSTLLAAQTQLGLAAGLSTQRSEDENQNGGTCGGSASQTGFGPVAKLRESHAATLGAVRDYTGARLAALDAAIGRAAPLLAEAKNQFQGTGGRPSKAQFAQLNAVLGDLARQANSLASDPGLVSYRNEMGAMAAGYRKPGGLVGGLTCLDPGMASVLEGAQHSLAAFREVPAPKFGVYQDNQATMEAMRRFYATTFGPIGWQGRGLSSVDEFLAYAVSWIVDLCLLIVVYVRGRLAPNLAGKAQLERARQGVIDSQSRLEASRLTISDRATAIGSSLRELEASPELPFADLFTEWRGERHIVVPMVGTGDLRSRQAAKMIDILVQLDGDSKSGVREQLRLSHCGLFGLFSKDRRARLALTAAGAGGWANGSQYRWFKVDAQGLNSLAAWVSALRHHPFESHRPSAERHQRGESKDSDISPILEGAEVARAQAATTRGQAGGTMPNKVNGVSRDLDPPGSDDRYLIEQ